MRQKERIVKLSFILLLTTGFFSFKINKPIKNDPILSYIVDPKKQDIQLYWKNNQGEILKNIQSLKTYVESKNLILKFAMNGGMFKKDLSPQGLFIQNKLNLSCIDTLNGNGNFYLMPNGIFYITTDNRPFVCKTSDFINGSNIKYATQSGPMLVIDGQIHPSFKDGSKNLNIRNGVGILPDNKVVFAISKSEINFYEFAKFFQNLGCKNALYLDGFVSKCYFPEKNWIQTDGNFGVIIGVTAKAPK